MAERGARAKGRAAGNASRRAPANSRSAGSKMAVKPATTGSTSTASIRGGPSRKITLARFRRRRMSLMASGEVAARRFLSRQCRSLSRWVLAQGYTRPCGASSTHHGCWRACPPCPTYIATAPCAPTKAKLSSRLAEPPKERKLFFSKRPRPISYLARMGGSSEAIVLQAMKAAFHLLCGLQSRYMMASTTPSQVEPRSLRAVARSASPATASGAFGGTG